MKTAFAVGAAALLLTACGVLPSSPAVFNVSEDRQLISIDLPNERRTAWAVKRGANASDQGYSICAEPPSDTGLSTSQLLNLTASLQKSQTEAGAHSSAVSNLVELKGRTPAVLALRDVMYRMCEARMHGELFANNSASSAIFERIVEVIGTFAAAELKSAEEQKARAEAAIPLVPKVADAGGEVGSWGVVFGADRSLEAAKPEVTMNAVKWGIADAKVYLRRGLYRSVAVAKDRADAEELLEKAQANAANRAPYIVNLSNWCQRPVPNAGYIVCE